MVVYEEEKGLNQKWVTISEIVVPTEFDKEQLLKAFKYIHDLPEIDSSFMAINTLMHFYHCPDKIRVHSNNKYRTVRSLTNEERVRMVNDCYLRDRVDNKWLLVDPSTLVEFLPFEGNRYEYADVKALLDSI